jgi:hypothetical protein
MRKTQRATRLTLHRETLHRLTRSEIAAARGGQAKNPTETCPYSGCFVCDPFPEIQG